MQRHDENRIAILEQNSEGHRFAYLSLLLEELSEHESDIELFVSEAVEGALDTLSFTLNSSFLTKRIAADAKLYDVLEASALCGRDTLIVPDGDRHLMSAVVASLGRSCPRLRLLLMQNPRWVLRSPTSVPPIQLLRNLIKFFTLVVARYLCPKIDVRELTYPRAMQGEWDPSSHFQVEDPVIVTDRPLFKPGGPSLDPGRRWIGIVGGISQRKNPLLVAEAISMLDRSVRTTVGFALLGPMHPGVSKELPEIRTLLDSAGVPLIVDDRPRSNAEMNGDVLRLDVVAMAYSTHAPNSTAAKAAYYGRHMLVAGPTQFRIFAEKISGQESTTLNAKSLEKRLNEILASVGHPPEREFAHASFFARALISD